MKLQELIQQTELDMNELQVKAFFLGVLCADKPLPFAKASEELLSDFPEEQKVLEVELKNLWDHLKNNIKQELAGLFIENKNIREYMEMAKDQLDYFLTGMSLAGTNTESCDDEELAELIDELEDTVEDMDDYLSDADASDKDGEDFKKFLVETWEDFVSSKD